MSALRFSVVIVSRGRPVSLQRCLRGVSQLYREPFEIVVVADGPGLAAARAALPEGGFKQARFDEANISAARNAGIALAAGDVIAFIDDDAVPEPGWLFHLAGAFAAHEIDAAGGFVRGRDGISFQYRGAEVSAAAEETPLATEDTRPAVFDGRPGRAIKTEGTNCAFRRAVFEGLGGFDPNYRYYLDETDLNMRLAAAGRKTALVPLAEVHHGAEASELRTARHMPRSLRQIGASLAVFLRKHASGTDPGPVLARAEAAQRRRLVRHMLRGNCEPRDVERVLATFREGVAEGMARPLAPAPPVGPAQGAFLPFTPFRPGHGLIAGHLLRARSLRARARAEAEKGKVVSLHLQGRVLRTRRVRFHPAGFWEHRYRISRPEGPGAAARREDSRVAAARHPWDMADQPGDGPKKTE